ncbi:hypothetical protein COLO4_38515, partial [Corchorus olitorius]
GLLQVFVSFHGICQEKSEHLIVEAMLRNCVSCSFPYLLLLLWVFLEWMTTGIIGLMVLLVLS